MADVTINYKGSKIAELSASGTKTLKTSGTYCEGDVSVSYTKPTFNGVNGKLYNLTLSKTSGWVLLTTLDQVVLDHINDANFAVTLMCTTAYEYVNYTMNFATATNTQIGQAGNYPAYGVSARQTSTSAVSQYVTYYKPNKTDTNTSLGGFAFRVTSGKYYIYPLDGYVRAGSYRLMFTW